MKEAVVIILDASSTMATHLEEEWQTHVKVEEGEESKNDNHDNNNNDLAAPLSRFEASKSAAQMLLLDLMTRSKTHEACVIFLKTPETSHHLMEELDVGNDDNDDDDDNRNNVLFPNLTELPLVGLDRPNTSFLRRVAQIKAASAASLIKRYDEDDDETTRGDFCDGMIVAADALHRRTHRKKYSRRIILITDAEHKVMVDQEQLSVLLESLCEMECRVDVVGWNFKTKRVDFSATDSSTQEAHVKQETHDNEGMVLVKEEDHDDEEMTPNDLENEEDGNNHDDNDDDGSDIEDVGQIKSQNEKLLLQLTRKTGGSVVGVSTMAQLLDAVLGGSQRKKVESVRRQCEFHIAPGMVLLSTRFSLLMQKASVPSLIREAVEIDEDTQLPIKNGLGEEMSHPTTLDYKHLDPDDPEVVLEEYDRTTAYRFGNDYIPIGKVDKAGLATLSPCCIRILGYVEAAVAPRHLVVGPPYAITGADSTHDCAAIAALSQGLHRLNYVAICTFVKTKDRDPILAGLFPLLKPCQAKPENVVYRLVLFQLPFAGDVQHFSLPSLEDHVDGVDTSCCDDLIDALMLSDDDLVCDHIPNPYLRLYNKTIGQRAADPSTSGIVVSERNIGGNDPMSTPKYLLEKAAPLVNAFYNQFPLVAVETMKDGDGNRTGRAGSKKRKGPVSARDFM